MRTLLLVAALAALPQDDYFPTKAGTCWTYSVQETNGSADTAKDQVAEVKSASSALRGGWSEVSHFLGYEKVYLRSDANGVFLRIEEPQADSDTGLLILKPALKAGDSWSGRSSDREETKFTVEGDEEIRTDAGTFKCVRIGIEITERTKSSANAEAKPGSKGTFWFASGTGIVKASISHDVDCHTTATKTYTLKKIEQK